MKYSMVLGKEYHQIGFTPENQFFIDIFFTAAAHHLIRYRQANQNTMEEKFHDKMFRSHLLKMMEIIYVTGDFRQARDDTSLHLHLRKNWNPQNFKHHLPDSRMFAAMEADGRFLLGEPHISDDYLSGKKLDLPINVLLREWGYLKGVSYSKN